MNYKDCVDTFELDSVFEEDAVISPEAAKNAQDLTKLILTRTLQIFYTQFMREEAQWAIQRGVPTRKLDQLVHILHSSHPVIFYFYNLTVLLRAYEQDSTKPIISKSIPSSDLPYVVKYLQSLLPDVKFYKQTAGPHDVESCIYAVSAAKTLIVPLPLPLMVPIKPLLALLIISQAQSAQQIKTVYPLKTFLQGGQFSRKYSSHGHASICDTKAFIL